MSHVIPCRTDEGERGEGGKEGGQYLGDDLANVSVHGLVRF
jgi:hypothetical protein